LNELPTFDLMSTSRAEEVDQIAIGHEFRHHVQVVRVVQNHANQLHKVLVAQRPETKPRYTFSPTSQSHLNITP
jgi:hypothetical protein